jgi:plasmid replication initiation protein
MKLTLEELRRLLGIEEESTYLEFKKLNQHVIAPAVAAINELTNLTVEVIPVKLGRKIASLQFKVTPKRVIDPTEE